MKKNLLLLSFIGLTGALNAQTTITNTPAYKKWTHQVHTIAKKNTAAYKATAMNERIAAISEYTLGSSTYSLSDSAKFLYSNGRGSTFDFNEMEFYYEEYNSRVMHDSMLHYSDHGTGLVIEEGYKAGYNSNNLMSSFAYLSASMPGDPLANQYKTDYTYDISGNLKKDIEFDWNSTQWDSTYRTDYTYDSQNRLTEDITFDFSVGQNDFKSVYSYDLSGNLISSVFSSFNMSAWQPFSRVTMTYDANHHLLTSKDEYNSMSGWKNMSLDTFGYNGVDFFTYREHKDWDSVLNSWVPYDKITRILNSKSLPDKQTDYNWNQSTSVWEPIADIYWSYNSNNNPTRRNAYPSSGSTLSTTELLFYYEYYFPQGVIDISKNGTITVYPNPATETVSIRWNGSMKNNTAAVALINTLGQVVYNNMQPVTGNETTLSLSSLPTGTYLLSVKDTEGKPIHAQTIVKQ